MTAESFIETGVDKLVRLVESKKKLSTAEAAKALGVSTAVIDEWSDFLEEEGLISIEYKLATTYLVERKLSKKEVVKKAKEFRGSKDAFIRKIETAMQGIERETRGLDDFKEQFEKLKKDIGQDLINVKDELKELENYESLKKNIDKQMYEQQREFRKKIGEMEKELAKEKGKYQELIDDMDVEKVRLQEERSQMLSLKEQEDKLLKKLDEFGDTVKAVREAIRQEDKKIGLTEEHIRYLEKTSEGIKERMRTQKEQLTPLEHESHRQEANILKIQDEVLKKVVKGKKKITDEVAESERIAEKFKEFFQKKAKVDSLIHNIEKDKHELEQELASLIKKAQAFDLASKSSSVQKHISELNKKFKVIENRRDMFKGKLQKLVSLLRAEF